MRLALAVALLALAGPALAAPSERNVVLVTAGDPADVRALAAIARDLLSQLGVTVEASTAPAVDPHEVIDRPASFEPALARVWIDMRAADHATLYLVDGPWERVLIRRVEREAKHGEVAREELAHILETAVEAMMAGARIGLERKSLPGAEPTAPPPEPPPVHRAPAAPPAPAGLRFHLGLFDQVTVFSSQSPIADTLGLSAAIESGAPPHWGGWLSIGYRWPIRAEAMPVGVRLEGLEARALGRVAVWSNTAWRVDLALGPGLDVMEVVPIATAQGAVVAAPHADASFIVRAAVDVRWRNILALVAVADIDATGLSYTFDSQGTSAVVLEPYRVRPGLLLEATLP